MGMKVVERQILVGLTGYPKNSLATLLLTLRKKGHVEYDSKTVRITEDGIREAGGLDGVASAVPKTSDAMHERIKENFVKGKKCANIYDVLSDGVARTKAQLAADVGVTNLASMGTYLSSMKAVGVVEYVDGGGEGGKKKGKLVQLSKMCFPLGRPGTTTATIPTTTSTGTTTTQGGYPHLIG